jgi:uncharacterized membrane protein YphA (DoxX/SURF4 family)
MNNCLSKKGDIATLIVRLIVGGIFIFSGWMKVRDMVGTIGFFGQAGIPSYLAYVVSYGELIGGILIVLGLWTCLASAFLSIIMIVAIYLGRAGGFQAYSLPLATLAGLVSLVGSCGGKYALSSFCKAGCCKGMCSTEEAPKI